MALKKIQFSIFFISLIFLNLIPISLCIKEWWEDTKIPILNDTNFYDVIGHDKYVVVKFFTKWCIYCKYMSPEYEKFYEQNKRDDVLIVKIECSISQKICMDYGVFSFPFIALFFPENEKMKSVFKYKRTAEDLLKWVNIIAPKKNLKQSNKENDKEKKLNETNNMTKIEDYIVKQFTDIKKNIKDIEDFVSNNTKYLNDIIKNNTLLSDENNEENIDVIEIKITPFFIIKCVGLFFLIRIILFYLKSYLFKHNPLPKNIHQKN